jgi:2-methylaconitate cis-trans-isomerase PrpF
MHLPRLRTLALSPGCRSTSASRARRLSTVPNPLPAAFLRGGTSKGVFINAAHLPADRAAWAPAFLRLMGSPDAEHGRQLDGMGGGVSSLSKICVVGPPAPERAGDVDVEYTFCQVGG